MISNHITETGKQGRDPHRFAWDKIDILHTENKLNKRLISEMIFLKKNNEKTLNKINDIDNLPKCYDILINII